jgi:hypothetical protein
MTNNNSLETLDWEVIAAALPPPAPDEYHCAYWAGATAHLIEWPESPGLPSGNQTRWTTYDAYACYLAHPWDHNAFETLVLSHVRLVAHIAIDVLRDRKRKVNLEFAGKDVGGADLFSVGMMTLVEVLKSKPEFGYDGEHDDTDISPDDPDELTQLARYIGRAVRNKMEDHLKKMEPRWLRKAVRQLDDDGDMLDHRGNALKQYAFPDEIAIAYESFGDDRHQWAWNALRMACREPYDWQLCRMKRQGLLDESEMGQALGLSRDQVNRAITRICRAAEKYLGLKEKPMRKRKTRRSPRANHSQPVRAELHQALA